MGSLESIFIWFDFHESFFGILVGSPRVEMCGCVSLYVMVGSFPNTIYALYAFVWLDLWCLYASKNKINIYSVLNKMTENNTILGGEKKYISFSFPDQKRSTTTSEYASQQYPAFQSSIFHSFFQQAEDRRHHYKELFQSVRHENIFEFFTTK